MVSRRRFGLSLCALLAAPATVRAETQPGRIPRVGFLQPVVPQNGTSPFLEDFRQGLQELGYAEGRNIELEIRWGDGHLERLPALAADLARMKVDVIVAVTSPSARPRTTTSAPTVSASDISTPPCMMPDDVHSSGAQGSVATTRSGPASSSAMPSLAANGIISIMASLSASFPGMA